MKLFVIHVVRHELIQFNRVTTQKSIHLPVTFGGNSCGFL